MTRSPENPGPFARRGISLGAWLAIGFGVGSLPVFLGPLNHDVAWYLLASGRVLAGERLYVNVIETNPPLIVWLSFGPTILARVLGISEILAVRLLVLGLVVGSLRTTLRVLETAWPGRERATLRRAALALGLFTLVPLAGYDFAQREHLMLILVFPYLIMASGRASGAIWAGPLPWAVGLASGLGFALKPHFVAVWLAVEVALITVRRDVRVAFRPESLGVLAVGLAYGVAILAIAPDYLRLIGWAGPIYSTTSRAPIGVLLGDPATLATVVAGLGFLAMRSVRGETSMLLVAALAFLGIAFLQDKGYTYHFYPPMALAVALIGLLAVARPGKSRLFSLVTRVVLATSILATAIARVHESWVWRGRPGASDTSLGRMIRIAKGELPGESSSLFVFSPAVPAGFPLVTYVGAGWASSHPSLWFLPSLYANAPAIEGRVVPHPVEAMPGVERFLFEGVVNRLLVDRPTLLFVDEREKPSAFDDRSFPYLDYYALDPRFARFLEDYEPIARVDEFRVYRRKTRNAP